MFKSYQIDLKNLSPATIYKFDYLLDNDFFSHLDGPEVRKGRVNVALSVVRVSSAFELDFRIDGVITVTCDRCLDEFEIPVETINRLIVTFGETYSEISDERIVIPQEEGFINIAWFMYEFIALAIPIKHAHKTGDCNKEMALKLRAHCVEERREEDECSASSNSHQEIDPRWDKLRFFREDN